jgi:ubiquinone/menaquinone biosynthesis C-methylase UbiE
MGWLIAKIYDPFMRTAEQAALGRWRAELLQGLSGTVLEVGAGTGANIAHYPPEVTRVVLTEPSVHMRQQLALRLTRTDARVAYSLVAADTESLPFDSDAFDAVVCTLVLCSVREPGESLREMRRVLRPRGRLVFLEHVAAAGEPSRLRWQRWLEPIWRRMADNCHLTRDTSTAIRLAGFEFEQLTREHMPQAPPFVAATIRGIAVTE